MTVKAIKIVLGGMYGMGWVQDAKSVPKINLHLLTAPAVL